MATQAINHELESGDELIESKGTKFEKQWQVTSVDDDGNVNVRVLGDHDAVIEGSETDTWAHEAVCNSLVDGILETPDGKSHELVRSF